MIPFVQDADFTLYVGDALTVLRELPDESVHCCVTSPPYWGLRDYGSEGQIGLEATPELFVANVVAVLREVRRVLRADGTLWLNLGDSYNSIRNDNPGDGFRTADDSAQPKGYVKGRGRNLIHGLKQKDLVGIPWRVAFALQADGWYLRSDIIWAKPNPMPESVTDRPTKAHEYVFLLTKSPRYFFDQEAVREGYKYDGRKVTTREAGEGSHENHRNGKRERWPGIGKASHEARGSLVAHGHDESEPMDINHGGRNVRSVWEIATQPYPEAHFATFPEALPERCIKAGTSERGCCPECGAAWTRATDVAYEKSPVHGAGSVVGRHYETGANNFDGAGMPRLNKVVTTTGWSPSCGHDREPVPCTVLDCFAGSGTTALVARKLGRRSIGIELSEEYARLAARRLQQLSLLAEPA